MTHPHAVVWLDHRTATIIDFSFDDQHVVQLHQEDGPRKLHRKANEIGTGKAPADHRFFDEIVAALERTRDVLVVGPGTAKHEFVRDLEHRHPHIAKRVVGVETADHPHPNDLLRHARKFFKRVDSLRGEVSPR